MLAYRGNCLEMFESLKRNRINVWATFEKITIICVISHVNIKPNYMNDNSNMLFMHFAFVGKKYDVTSVRPVIYMGAADVK